MRTASRASMWLAGTVTLLAVTACSAPTINGFTLTSGPATVSVVPGNNAYITVASKATGSNAVTAAIVVYGLPMGVTLAPASPTVASGSQTALVLTAAPDAPVSSNKVQISGYAGLASSDSYVTVSVVAP